MEVLPGAVKLPDPVAQRLHQGAAEAGYFALVAREKDWRERARTYRAATLGACLGVSGTLIDPLVGAAFVGLGVFAGALCLLRSRSYGKKASAA
jgi:hypothetical protein